MSSIFVDLAVVGKISPNNVFPYFLQPPQSYLDAPGANCRVRAQGHRRDAADGAGGQRGPSARVREPKLFHGAVGAGTS